DGEVAIPPFGEVSPLHLIDFPREVGMGGAVRGEERAPPAPRVGAPGADAGREVLAHTVGGQELRVFRPAVAALWWALAVGRGAGVLVGGAVADVTVEDDQGGTALRLPEGAERALDAIDVVGVAHAQDVPAVCEESGGDVLGAGNARLPFGRGAA